MKHLRKNIKIDKRTFFSISFFLLLSFVTPLPKSFAFDIDRSGSVSVSAGIEEARVVIYGFTSPFARVELSNSKVFDVTYAKDNGYFEFDRIILPKNPGELCIVAVDDSNRYTSPVCVPPPPPTNYLTNIGPIVLPPTLTIDSSTIKANSTTAASGQSVPYSVVNVYLYQADSRAPLLPKPAQAFGLPIFTTKTDREGNYDLNIPTTLSTDYRLFSTVDFASQSSPKSNTITYSLPQAFNLWIILTPFIFTILLFGYLTYLYYRQNHVRYLPAVFSYPLTKYISKL